MAERAFELEAQPERPRKPGTFSKGDLRINRNGRPRGPQAADQECGIRPCLLLRDMRLVYAQQEGKDRTEGQRMLRKLLEKNPQQFIAQLVRLEKAHAPARQAPEAQAEAASGVLPMDDGTARVRGLLDELLGKCREERGPGAAGGNGGL
jgi:hypothetical protein